MSFPPPTRPTPARPRVIGKVIIGCVCLLLAFIGVVATFVLIFVAFFSTDAEVPVDGRPHTVSLEDSDRRMLLVEEGAHPTCEVRDTDGDLVALDRPGPTFTRSINGEDRVGQSTFDPPGDEVEVTCSGEEQLDVQVVPSPLSGVGAVILLVGLGGSAVLGVVGLVLLIVALVKKVSPRAP